MRRTGAEVDVPFHDTGQPKAGVGRNHPSAHAAAGSAPRPAARGRAAAVALCVTAPRGAHRGRRLRGHRRLQAPCELASDGPGARTRPRRAGPQCVGAAHRAARGQPAAAHALANGRSPRGLLPSVRGEARPGHHRQGLRQEAPMGLRATHPGRAALRSAAAPGRRGRARRDAGQRALRARPRRPAGRGRRGGTTPAQGTRGTGPRRRVPPGREPGRAAPAPRCTARRRAAVQPQRLAALRPSRATRSKARPGPRGNPGPRRLPAP